MNIDPCIAPWVSTLLTKPWYCFCSYNLTWPPLFQFPLFICSSWPFMFLWSSSSYSLCVSLVSPSQRCQTVILSLLHIPTSSLQTVSWAATMSFLYTHRQNRKFLVFLGSSQASKTCKYYALSASYGNRGPSTVEYLLYDVFVLRPTRYTTKEILVFFSLLTTASRHSTTSLLIVRSFHKARNPRDLLP